MPTLSHRTRKRREPHPSDLLIRSDLPQWVVRSLRASGLSRLSAVAAIHDKDLLDIPGIGHRALMLIRQEVERVTVAKGDLVETGEGKKAGLPDDRVPVFEGQTNETER